MKYFKGEKTKALRLYIACLDKQAEDGNIFLDQLHLKEQRNKFWKTHLHFEELLCWCNKEKTKRSIK